MLWRLLIKGDKMRLSYSHNCNPDTWLATGYQKMCMWAGAVELGGDFVLQGVTYGRRHSEEKHSD